MPKYVPVYLYIALSSLYCVFLNGALLFITEWNASAHVSGRSVEL